MAEQQPDPLADIFTHQVKPYEVEILVVEISDNGEPASLYRILYDGTLADESGFAAIGGQAEALAEKVADGFDATADLAGAIRHAAQAFEAVSDDPIAGWEAAVLEANGKRREHDLGGERQSRALLLGALAQLEL